MARDKLIYYLFYIEYLPCNCFIHNMIRLCNSITTFIKSLRALIYSILTVFHAKSAVRVVLFGGIMAKTSNTHREIEITDPDRWGLKFTEKRKWNYQLRMDFFSDPDINAVSNDSKMLFLGIIMQSLRENKVIVKCCLEYFKVSLRLSLGETKVCLNELISFNIISLPTGVRTSYRIEKNKIKKNIIENEKSCMFDLLQAYKNYPSNSGKKLGLDKLNKIITTQQKYDELIIGIDNYKKMLSENDWRKPQNFSTFVNQEAWLDYQEVEKTSIQKLDEEFAALFEGDA